VSTADEAVTQKNISNESRYLRSQQQKIVAGEFAFELNDTYGFPIDLTSLMAREIGWSVDMDGYETALQQQKNRSRAATTTDNEDWIVLDKSASTEFVGYSDLEAKTKVVKYRKVTSKGKELTKWFWFYPFLCRKWRPGWRQRRIASSETKVLM
jgi:alanyl-tRNA synthetase